MSNGPRVHLVGGGIASLAAAVLLIRDAGFSGEQIEILEQHCVVGGSLDGSGAVAGGYLTRGGRMFEPHFACIFDLLDSIPTLHDPGCSVGEDIRRFTREVVPSSNCRLVDGNSPIPAPAFELSWRDRIDLLSLNLRSERSLRTLTIEEYFRPGFFDTNFWLMWSTMFAFRSWHSVAEFRRYMRRFMHLLPGFNRLEGICRTRWNQYDSIVQPLEVWLRQRGVRFATGTQVVDVRFNGDRTRIRSLRCKRQNEEFTRDLSPDDLVLITLGSMTEAATIGTMTQAPPQPVLPGPAWALWRNIAGASTQFGEPEAFIADSTRTTWTSFTVTLSEGAFFEYMERFTGNAAGTGGLVTFKRSGWLLSVVLAHQPHFREQAEDSFVFWGYGLHAEAHGEAVDKPLVDCTGAEILTELCHHLKLDRQMFAGARCRPARMPWITAQFMPRPPGARPSVVPAGAKNFAFLGQFCELPDDTVFTVEYSVRTAQTAVHRLCPGSGNVTPMFKGFRKPNVIYPALAAIMRDGQRPS